MNKILSKNELAPNVIEYVFDAPLVARHAKAGQFVILRVDEEGERVPFTLCDMDNKKGTITLLIQSIGYTTMKLAELEVNDSVASITGPLGNSTNLSSYDKILLVGGGIGGAVTFPQLKYLSSIGKKVDNIIGAKTKELIVYKDNFDKYAENSYVVTDDGTLGDKGFVTDKIKKLIEAGNKYDVVFAVGPMMMMRAVCNLTKQHNIKTVVSLNTLMVDGTGMCGSCRVTVDGETKYTCVDGPEFDGHLVDFDEAINRSKFYNEQETEHRCRLTGEIHGKNK